MSTDNLRRSLRKRWRRPEKSAGPPSKGINNNHVFYLGVLNLVGERKLEYYITSSLRQGLVHFATHAGILFQVLRPWFAIYAGVFAGNATTGVELGQVIFGDAAMSYEEGKSMSRLAGFAAGKYKYKSGDYVSRLSVREDAVKIFERITVSADRNVLTLDMEASAFLNLCAPHRCHVARGYQRPCGRPPRRSPAWLEQMMESMNWDVNEEKEIGARLAKPYYENFVRVVVDWISQGLPLELLNQGRVDQQPQGLKIVMPKNLNPEKYAEVGHIHNIAQTFGLTEAAIGNGSHRRTMYYRHPYLFGFPRTLNSLLVMEGASYQALVFDKFLKLGEILQSPELEVQHASGTSPRVGWIREHV
ncbi:Phosphorylase superfamily protein [Cladophialophora carrionii]|uniref:Phosphorylase superfamily protein n=1 Tax=Cladophialophora carrionii TaxID=86049 RepID=A0A1C1CGE5_9EURO|nr:Phosphorylase superfamily protein [Cladophialophora carrionii]